MGKPIMIVTGNLGGEVEVRTTTAGKKWCKFSIAANYKDRGEDVTMWFGVTAFDEYLVKFAESWLKQGSLVQVSGKFSTTQGDSRTFNNLDAMSIDFVGGKRDDSDSNDRNNYPGGSNAPQGGQSQQQSNRNDPPPPGDGDFADDEPWF